MGDVFIPVRRAGELAGHAIVDEADAPELLRWRWSLNGGGYPCGAPGMMHRAVLGLQVGDGLVVHHLDHDKLNNRRSNLRLVTHSENARASRWRGAPTWAEIVA